MTLKPISQAKNILITILSIGCMCLSIYAHNISPISNETFFETLNIHVIHAHVITSVQTNQTPEKSCEGWLYSFGSISSNSLKSLIDLAPALTGRLALYSGTLVTNVGPLRSVPLAPLTASKLEASSFGRALIPS